jgi:hypothetical protein
MKRLSLLLLGAPALLGAACASPADEDNASSEGAFQGTISNLAELSFETEVRAPTQSEAERLLTPQLYWMVGPFHDLGGDPRLTWAKTETLGSETVSSPTREGVAKFRVTMEVAWPKDVAMPARYEMVFPRRIDQARQKAFYAKYKGTCIDEGHDQDWSTAWYDFKPARPDCNLDDADVIRVSASVRKKQDNTTNTYPEYDRIWEDKKFQAVVVFGRDVPGSTNDDDSGALDYAKYVNAFKNNGALGDKRVTETTFDDVGREAKQTTIDATMDGGRSVHVVVFLLSKPSWSGNEFARRYNDAFEDADYVAYSGHAGLGGNIQKLQSLGRFTRGKYQVFVYDGCDTFAYIDKTLFDKKKAANGAVDPDGTKDMDLVLNALPTPWAVGDPSILKLTRSLMDDARPTPYSGILGQFATSGAPVVVGDEDNQFQPRR